MDREDYYRQKAAGLRRLARTERNVSALVGLKLLAIGYDGLVDRVRRNAKNNIGPEYDPQPPDKTRQQRRQAALAQQQQRQRPERGL